MIQKLLIILAKFRVWGIPGICDYLTKRYVWWKFAGKFRRIARLDAQTTPASGITLIGDFKLGASNSKTLRDFAHALKDANIPFQALSIDRKCTIPPKDYVDILTPWKEFRLHKYSHVIEMFRSPLPRDLVKNRARIAFWEGEQGMFEVWPFLKGNDPIIGMSDFNVTYFKKNADRAPVYKITYPLRKIDVPVPPASEVRKHFGIDETAFVVFFNFDFGSYHRKNPLAAIRAFATAFRDDHTCILVFKTQGAKAHRAELEELHVAARTAGIESQFKVISEYLPHELLYGLTAACDVYLSLHRGEGFGIGMAEAMLFGKPVVATNWSANTEFCNEDNSLPVPYRMVPIKPGEYFESMKEWAEADVEKAAEALKKVHDDPELREEIGREAKDFIESHFSLENFKKSVNAFLEGRQ